MSNEEKNRITVDIYGHHYTIVGTESNSHIRHVARLVDEKMRDIKRKNPVLDLNKIAVLTAVNTVHDYVKLQEEIELLKAELKELKD
ncbi:cell division protein ZapA [Bacillus badius]|uniref:Cell division protein ZapA n=1 Tax=Bacillus badius TaxID=1455 RepID=A0ABR5AT13_BACBA|nr:cell division protein ZapA [Bacillus badius]KIL75541.1 Z-ring-associated protein [Bacillus badius]KIL77897.1 Z-ring-associated protein [Bacillus badius]KZN98632.1 cell division protein ZapA [Bacillus badius]KZR58286.1 cell division protein ZapA [Bacillus badius]MED0666384.1 cell division protein ZapA [Bacillus badius]